MARRQIGTVMELFRYPVKSMLGERLERIEVGAQGVIGDRAWALRDLRTGNIVSAKKWARMFEFSAAYEVAAEADQPGRVRIEMPDQTSIYADDPWASRAISEVLGFEVHLERASNLEDKRLVADIDTGTIFMTINR